jgi:outer membrane immunogenic protein
MRFLIAGLIGVTAIGVSAAGAADIPARAPVYSAPAALVAVDTWSGIYLGVNGGWAKQDHDWAFHPPFGTVNQSFSLDRSSGVIGLHAGLQKQFGQWVLGAEFAYNWLGSEFARHTGFGVDFSSFADARAKEVWTAGPRIGWAPSPTWMIFANGGFASGKVQTRLTDIATGVPIPAFDTSATQNGWYLGAGIEYMLFANVILGAEYQHIDLGSDFHCVTFACGGAPNSNNHDVKTTVDIVRARLTYKFDWFR